MTKTVSRAVALLLAALLCLGLTACGGDPAPESSAPTGESTTTTTTAADAADTPEVSDTPTTTTTAPTTGTTVHTKNVQHGITHTTTTTEAPTTRPAPKKPMRILSIGHSFSHDAIRKNLWEMLNGAGYDYVVIGILFTPSCSLDEQWERMQGKADHETYCKSDPYTGEFNYYGPAAGSPKNKVQYAITDEKWDVITIQPDPDYGTGIEYWPQNNDYTHVGDIVNWINKNKTNPQGKIWYHMTWSFANDCRLWCFQPFGYDQVKQYNAFVAATKKYIFGAHPGKFAGVIPAGTSIQNARTSRLGDTFNNPGNNDPKADGYHLNDKGDYVAALTWYAALTGKSASTAWCPAEYKADFPILAEAVDHAVKVPYGISVSSYK